MNGRSFDAAARPGDNRLGQVPMVRVVRALRPSTALAAMSVFDHQYRYARANTSTYFRPSIRGELVGVHSVCLSVFLVACELMSCCSKFEFERSIRAWSSPCTNGGITSPDYGLRNFKFFASLLVILANILIDKVRGRPHSMCSNFSEFLDGRKALPPINPDATIGLNAPGAIKMENVDELDHSYARH